MNLVLDLYALLIIYFHFCAHGADIPGKIKKCIFSSFVVVTKLLCTFCVGRLDFPPSAQNLDNYESEEYF